MSNSEHSSVGEDLKQLEYDLKQARDRIANLEDELRRLAEVVCEQDYESITSVLEGTTNMEHREPGRVVVDDLLDRIRLALCDPEAPWYGSDLVPMVADLCDLVDWNVRNKPSPAAG